MGRRPIGHMAMTTAERQRKHRAQLKAAERSLPVLEIVPEGADPIRQMRAQLTAFANSQLKLDALLASICAYERREWRARFEAIRQTCAWAIDRLDAAI
jgi:hypothetical protein